MTFENLLKKYFKIAVIETVFSLLNGFVISLYYDTYYKNFYIRNGPRALQLRWEM